MPSLNRVVGTVLVCSCVLIIICYGLGGCPHKPKIPGYHWHGSNLYDDKTGEEVAAVVAFPFGIDASQDCIYAASKVSYHGCSDWETGQEAYDHVALVFAQASAAKGRP